MVVVVAAVAGVAIDVAVVVEAATVKVVFVAKVAVAEKIVDYNYYY